ncbi:MAG: transcriptional regulator [Legionellaceae bacterium]|nr:transcriptional regulator [Legionellaceae bacterium]
MNTTHKVAVVGVISLEDFKKRTIAIAKGEYKPNKNEPKIWFNSIKSLAHVLSEENRNLLKIIIEKKPRSVSELEPLTGRKANNLLRTLRTMEHHGLVSLNESTEKKRGRQSLIPMAIYDTVDIKLDFRAA